MPDSHLRLDDEICERAALYVLSLLPSDELAVFEEHLRGGCPVCNKEVETLEGPLHELGHTQPPASPPPEVRTRMMSQASAKSRPAAPPTPNPPGVLLRNSGLLLARSGEVTTHPGVIPGVESRILFVDTAHNNVTALVRMRAGTVYPSHRHHGTEEIYLLEGDMDVEGWSLRAGDYCRAEAGSVHAEVRTRNGCLLFVTSSPSDEFVS